jgi:SAM-dependent methyltransferase
MDAFDISVKRFDEFAIEYAERFNDINAYLLSIDHFCDLIKKDDPKILELACGPGNVTRYIRHRFPESEYMAIDLAPNMIDIARQQITGVDFEIMDVRLISTIKTKFDAIMCAFCLPFLSGEDACNLIADCAGQLNDNGVIYISTMEGDESKAGFETTSFTGNSKVFFNYHELHILEKALLENGFLINDIRRQDYIEPNGTTLIDLILIGIKTSNPMAIS